MGRLKAKLQVFCLQRVRTLVALIYVHGHLLYFLSVSLGSHNMLAGVALFMLVAGLANLAINRGTST